MKILYHHRTRATDAQGVHIAEMVNAFGALGHEVKVVSLVATAAEPGQTAGAKDTGEASWRSLVRRIPFSFELLQLGYNLVGLGMVVIAIVREKPRFLYERYALFNFSGVLAARICGVPIVVEVNSPLALEERREKTIRLYRLASAVERWILNSASHVIAVSGPLRRILIEEGARGGDHITVLSNGVNLEHFQQLPDAKDLRRALSVEDRVVIGFVGWFRPWHGLGMLLEAFHKSGLGSRGATLLFIGDGPAMPDLRRFVETHDLSESVIFAGAVAHEEIPAYLSLINIAVQPAANEYCCPMKILEYLALGKPIVAPRQDNIRELVDDGDQAMLFEPGDADSLTVALSRLVEDRDLRSRMGVRARAAIRERRYLWTHNAETVLNLVASETAAS